MNAEPHFTDEDAAIDGQVLASFRTLIILAIFCAGVAFGIYVSTPQ